LQGLPFCYNDFIMANKTKQEMIFIVGLGNPGEEYRATPHSVGLMVVDAFAKRFGFPESKMEPDGIMVSKKEMDGITVILAKPQLFMNNSGKAIAKLFSYLKVKKTRSYPNLWVVNDDLDLPLGKIKIGQNRGSAGHKGVQSVIDTLKTKNFVRLRVGISPADAALQKIPADKFVLKKINPKGQAEFDKAIDLSVSALETALSRGLEKSMTMVNQKLKLSDIKPS